VGEGIAKPGCRIHLEEDVGYPYVRDAPIEIEDEFIGILWCVCRQTVNPQGAVFDAAMRDGASSDGFR
jgi:hypothetical protein